jgi:hypothetical protein
MPPPSCPEFIPPWWSWYPYVGTFIGILAGLGVLVPWFRGSEIGKREKAFWTFVMLGLVVLELRSITLDSHQHDRDQAMALCHQLQSFQKIADKLNESLTLSRNQYQSTIDHVNGVLTTTQTVAGLAKENLLNVTGGNTFAYVKPQNYLDSKNLFVTVTAQGKRNLTGVSVYIAKILLRKCPTEERASPACPVTTEVSFADPIEVGTLMGNSSRNLPSQTRINVDTDYSAQYQVSVYAQNGMTTEQIWLRKSKDEHGSAYRLVVYWTGTANLEKQIPVIRTDWIEPVPRSALPQ